MSSHVLDVEPDSELKFTLSHSEATPRCVMTLKHPGYGSENVAFKVRAVFFPMLRSRRLPVGFYAV